MMQTMTASIMRRTQWDRVICQTASQNPRGNPALSAVIMAMVVLVL